MLTANKAKQVTKINPGVHNGIYDAILNAACKGYTDITIPNKNITHSTVSDLRKVLGYKVSFKNGETIISWD